MTNSYNKLKESSIYSQMGEIITKAEEEEPVIALFLTIYWALIIIPTLVIHGFYLATRYLGPTLARKTVKYLDPTFSIRSKNLYLDLLQHLSKDNKNKYTLARKVTLSIFEQKWAQKQLEFNSL